MRRGWLTTMLAALLLPALAGLATPARANELLVGPGRALKLPSDAVAQAGPGDTILIDPGEYFDCIMPHVDRLTIAGAGPGVVLTDRVCAGKALVVADGADLVLRDLTLQRARAPDGNGAGIRAEGRNLTVQHVRFVDNQAGIVAADVPDSTLRIQDSEFLRNGSCDGAHCVDTLNAGAIAHLVVERSVFTGTKGAHQIVSAARATDITGSRIADGPDGSSSYQLFLTRGGSLTMTDNALEKGPHAANTRCAVLLDGRITGPLVFRRNRFDNDTGTAMPFILNWSDGTPVLDGNVLGPADWATSTRGSWTHAARQSLVAMKDGARHLAGAGLRAIHGWWR